MLRPASASELSRSAPLIGKFPEGEVPANLHRLKEVMEERLALIIALFLYLAGAAQADIVAAKTSYPLTARLTVGADQTDSGQWQVHRDIWNTKAS
jgi:hypothetical protein